MNKNVYWIPQTITKKDNENPNVQKEIFKMKSISVRCILLQHD